MASRILQSGMTFFGNFYVDTRYDPENGNAEIVEQGPLGQVIFKNGEWTEYGKSIITAESVRTELGLQFANDIRAAAATTRGKIQPWAQDPNTAQPAPTTPGAPTDGGGSAPSTQDNPFQNIDPASLDLLTDQLQNFGDENENNFDGINQFLKYPLSIENGQDRIMIQQIEYVTSGITGSESNPSNVGTLLGNRESQFKAQTKIKGTVILPMPNDISETNTTGWGESSLSTISAALMKEAAGIAQAVGGDQSQIINRIKSLGGTLGSEQITNRLGQYLTANAAASILKMGGINVDPEAYISRVTGTAINPNLELLFNGPKLRQFGFTFKMTPRSVDEAKNIRSIVKFFKKGMAPRRSKKAAQSIFLGTPNVFRIKFMSANEIGGVGKIKTCALVSCAVNYTPDGFYASYEDPNSGSQPISTTIQLAFTELTPVYNDDYEATKESASSTIGPEGFDYVVEGAQGAQ